MELVTLGAPICDGGTGGGECVRPDTARANSQHSDYHLFAVVPDICAVAVDCQVHAVELFGVSTDRFSDYFAADLFAGVGDRAECVHRCRAQLGQAYPTNSKLLSSQFGIGIPPQGITTIRCWVCSKLTSHRLLPKYEPHYWRLIRKQRQASPSRLLSTTSRRWTWGNCWDCHTSYHEFDWYIHQFLLDIISRIIFVAVDLLELPAYQHTILSSGSAPLQRDIRLIA